MKPQRFAPSGVQRNGERQTVSHEAIEVLAAAAGAFGKATIPKMVTEIPPEITLPNSIDTRLAILRLDQLRPSAYRA